MDGRTREDVSPTVIVVNTRSGTVGTSEEDGGAVEGEEGVEEEGRNVQ